MKLPPAVLNYFQKCGRRGGRIGGKKKSPAKTAAAKRNILLRWKRYREFKRGRT